MFRVHAQLLRERFPKRRDVRIANFWGGALAYTAPLRPAVGVAYEHGHVLYRLVDAGTGVPQTSMMGAFLAEMMQGREHLSARALQHRGCHSKGDAPGWETASLLQHACHHVAQETGELNLCTICK